MSKWLKGLQDRKAAVYKRMRDRLDKLREDGLSELSAEAQTEHDADKAALSKLDKEIADEKELVEIERGLSIVDDPNVDAARGGKKKSGVDYARERQPRHFHGEHGRQDAYRVGMWALAVLHGDAAALSYCREHNVGNLAQSSVIDVKGGVLVPEEMGAVVDVLRYNYGVIRREARNEPMKGDVKNVPKSTGLVTMTFIGENQEIDETEATFGNIKLVAKKLAAIIRWPRELDEDSVINVADKLVEQLAIALAKKEDECGFLGNGSSTYGGINGLKGTLTDTHHSASLVTTSAGQLAFSDLTLNHFESMMGALPEYATNNAKWYISKAGYAASMQRLQTRPAGRTRPRS